MTKFKTILFSFLGLIGLSGLIFLVSSLLINHKNQNFINEINAFSDQFTSTKSNESSRNLDILITKIGLGKVNIDTTKEEQNKTPELDNILTSLNSFLRTKLTEKTYNYDSIPQDLQKFLGKNKTQIIEIRDYLLISEKPTWEYNVEEMFRNPLNYPLPHLVEIVNLQKILMLQILSDYSQGNTQEIDKTLEVSFKLNQSLQNQPYLISQLVSVIIAQYQAGILRQIKDLAPQWETKLVNYSYDYQEGILNALNIESLIIGSPFIFEGESGNAMFNLFKNSYWKLVSKDTAYRMKKAFSALETQDICSADINQLETELQKFSWWNIYGDIATPNFSDQWLRGGSVMLDLELTHKILQAEIIKQKTSEYPHTLANLNSQVCPNQKWEYDKIDNQVTINFSQELPWKKLGENQGNTFTLPVNFTLKN
jgi:hypothetical protein